VNSAGAGDTGRVFFDDLRRKKLHLGMEPEFSTVEQLVLAKPEDRRLIFRETMDRFFFGRGMSVLGSLREQAAKAGNQSMVGHLDGLGNAIQELFKGQFNSYGAVTLPQSQMINQMLRLTNDNRADDVLEFMDQNIQHLDGHFFVILSESIRTARSKGSDLTANLLIMMGRLAAGKRLEKHLPCSFAPIFA
jgi:hypothetical protein